MQAVGEAHRRRIPLPVLAPGGRACAPPLRAAGELGGGSARASDRHGACLPDASRKYERWRPPARGGERARGSTRCRRWRWWRRPRRELLLRVHRHRLRKEDLEDCYSQATLELLAQARAGGELRVLDPRAHGERARAALRLAHPRPPPRAARAQSRAGGARPRAAAGRRGERHRGRRRPRRDRAARDAAAWTCAASGRSIARADRRPAAGPRQPRSIRGWSASSSATASAGPRRSTARSPSARGRVCAELLEASEESFPRRMSRLGAGGRRGR